ncbi:MAG: YciI family protein [Thermoanaerobaculia bacterium]|nr:YciI family protein [Thermoanaerobaculia bacterium]
MPKFMFLQRSGEECAKERSPKEMQQSMQVWGAWMSEGLSAGWLLDPGDALQPGGKVLQRDGTVTDGPFAESKELVGGYCMIEAEDLEAATARALSMPDTGGVVEIRQLAGHSME